MDKSSLKRNSLRGVLRRNPCIIQIGLEFDANLPERGLYRSVQSRIKEQLISTSTSLVRTGNMGGPLSTGPGLSRDRTKRKTAWTIRIFLTLRKLVLYLDKSKLSAGNMGRAGRVFVMS